MKVCQILKIKDILGLNIYFLKVHPWNKISKETLSYLDF